jgi:hypothetical protein
MTNKEELNRYLSELSKRKPVRRFKSDKGYNRVRDRKNKNLYEIDSEEEHESVEKTQGLL